MTLRDSVTHSVSVFIAAERKLRELAQPMFRDGFSSKTFAGKIDFVDPSCLRRRAMMSHLEIVPELRTVIYSSSGIYVATVTRRWAGTQVHALASVATLKTETL